MGRARVIFTYVTVVITIVGTKSGMGRLGLVLECLAELSKRTVGAVLGACWGGRGVEVWSLLLAEM